MNDPSRLTGILRNRGVLEWYSVEEGPYANPVEAMAQHGGTVPPNRKLMATKPTPDRGRSWYLLESRPIVRGTDLRDARAGSDTMNQPVTTFMLIQDAATRFEQFTQAHIEPRSPIVLDDQILCL